MYFILQVDTVWKIIVWLWWILYHEKSKNSNLPPEVSHTTLNNHYNYNPYCRNGWCFDPIQLMRHHLHPQNHLKQCCVCWSKCGGKTTIVFGLVFHSTCRKYMKGLVVPKKDLWCCQFVFCFVFWIFHLSQFHRSWLSSNDISKKNMKLWDFIKTIEILRFTKILNISIDVRIYFFDSTPIT